ncbi:MAG: glycosyltransferase family 39 protein [Thermoleophilia bacterium]
MRRAALGLVLAAAAALRFPTLDTQSLWLDEAVTARLLRMDPGAMLRAIPDSESTPPLYYVLAWLWTQLFGTGEVGMRSLSALLGTATVALVWALGRRIGGGDRAAFAAAALVAVNPMLVWFSQEARAYALVALLTTLSALLWLRALERPQAAGRLLAWGAAAALALATHYYAAFLVAPQALWLALRVPGWRERGALLALPGLTAAALAPLALGQRENDTAAFITASELLTRLAQVPKQFLVGYDAPLEPLLVGASALAVLAGLAGLAALLRGGVEATETERGECAALAGLAAAALVLPALAAVAGEDHLITRNVVFVLPLALALAGAGLAAVARWAPRLAAVALAAACIAGIVAVAGVARSDRLQRDDWRAAVRALGPIDQPRLIVSSAGSFVALQYYLPGLRQATPPAFTTAEIDQLTLPVRPPGGPARPPRPADPVPPAPGFALVGRTEAQTFTVLRWAAPAAVAVPVVPAVGLDGEPAALFTAVPEADATDR